MSNTKQVGDIEGRFFRIQCKNGKMMSGCIRFKSSSTEWYKIHARKHYRGQVEYFGVYCPELDKAYLIPVEIVGTSQGVLRIDPSKNNQTKLIHWCKEYEI